MNEEKTKEISDVVNRGYDPETNTLNGRPFIGVKVKYGPAGSAGESMLRRCGLCFYHDEADAKPTDDCNILGKLAHEYFGIPPDEKMPTEIDGKQVGHFCPNWLDFRVD